VVFGPILAWLVETAVLPTSVRHGPATGPARQNSIHCSMNATFWSQIVLPPGVEERAVTVASDHGHRASDTADAAATPSCWAALASAEPCFGFNSTMKWYRTSALLGSVGAAEAVAGRRRSMATTTTAIAVSAGPSLQAALSAALTERMNNPLDEGS
jgi:hypothetical protein